MWGLVKNGIIENIIELDNPEDYTPPLGFTLAELEPGVGIGWLYAGGAASPPAPAPQPEPPTIAQLIATQLASINSDCETAIATITAGYPSSEILSWPKQEAEARAYIADNAAATPLLDALAQARGIDKADLAVRVIVKADVFSALSGSLIGKRQALEDALMALPSSATSEQIAAIVWPL